MKRDMDLVRGILMAIEDAPSGFAPNPLLLDGHTAEEIGYHIVLLIEAGLVEGSDVTSFGSSSPEAMATRLTWQGHEWIANARSPRVWREAKGVVAKLGEVSMQVWTSVLTQVAMRSLGLAQ